MSHFDPAEHDGDPYDDFTLTAQQQHDVMACRRKPVSAGSRKRLQKVLATKVVSTAFDPIASAMADHPGLTREQAEADARAAGF